MQVNYTPLVIMVQVNISFKNTGNTTVQSVPL